MEDQYQPTLFYDPECTLCLRFKQALDRIPGTDRIQKLSIHEDETFKKFPQLNREECEKEIHLIDGQGNILKGDDVIKYLISQFPGVRKFSWLLESKMGQKALEYFNTVAKKSRESLRKRCPACKN